MNEQAVNGRANEEQALLGQFVPKLQAEELSVTKASLMNDVPQIELADGRQLTVKHLAIVDFRTYIVAGVSSNDGKAELEVFRLGNLHAIFPCSAEESLSILALSQSQNWGPPRQDWFESLFFSTSEI